MRSNPFLLGLIVVAAHFVACEGTAPVAPSGNEEGSPVHPSAAPVIVTESAIGEVPGSASGVSGDASLTRSPTGLALDLEVDGLTSGFAYTVWWFIFDNPQGCDGVCDLGDGFADLFRRQAQVSVLNAGGFVAEGGTNAFQAHLARHDVEGRQVIVGDPSGVDNPYKAEVFVVIRNHGEAEADPEDLMQQTSTFGPPFCNLLAEETAGPQPPADGILDGCLDQGVSVFLPSGAPGQGS